MHASLEVTSFTTCMRMLSNAALLLSCPHSLDLPEVAVLLTALPDLLHSHGLTAFVVGCVIVRDTVNYYSMIKTSESEAALFPACCCTFWVIAFVQSLMSALSTALSFQCVFKPLQLRPA